MKQVILLEHADLGPGNWKAIPKVYKTHREALTEINPTWRKAG